MSNKKILIIDDSVTARLLFKMCFNDLPGYDIIQAHDWQEGFKMSLEQSFFMIVLDYNMPEKNGLEVAKDMQDAGVKTHYVLLTANTQQYIVDEAAALGFSDIIEKPISLESIQTLLEKVA